MRPAWATDLHLNFVHDAGPLPTFSQRLTAFREELHHTQVIAFTNRIRKPALRKRVREFLTAM